MADGMAGLGQLMNPMLPQAQNQASGPSTPMVSPNAPKQPGVPPAPQGGTPPAGTPPMGTGQTPAIMPQQMPDIVQLLMQKLAMGGGQGAPPGMAIPGIPAQGTTVAPGIQSAPTRGAPPTVGGM